MNFNTPKLNPDNAIELSELLQSVERKTVVEPTCGTFWCSFTATQLFSSSTSYKLSSQPIGLSGLKEGMKRYVC